MNSTPVRPVRRFGISLRWKLFILVTLLVMVPVSFLVVTFAQALTDRLHESSVHKARSLAKIAAEQVTPAVLADAPDVARATFMSLREDPDLVAFELFRDNGTILFAGHPNPPESAPDEAEANRDLVELSVPILTEQGARGRLHLAFTDARTWAAVHEIHMTAAWVAALTIGLGILAGVIAAKKFGGRIARVKLRAEEIARGDFSSPPLDDPSRDEIGQMARAFQRMVGNFELEVKRRTSELEASREEFRKLLESTHAVPWRYDLDLGRFTYLGPRASELFGVEAGPEDEELAFGDHLDPATVERLRTSMESAWRQRRDGEFELTFDRRDGRRTTLRAVFSPNPAHDTRVLFGFMLDVTRQHELELELRQAQKLESVGRLAAGVAHEINTPLQFVTDSLHFITEAHHDTRKLLELHRDFRDHASPAPDAPEPHAGDATRAISALVQAESDLDLEYLDAHVPKALERVTEGLARVTTIVRAMNEFAHPDVGTRIAADLNDALRATLTICRNEYKDVAQLTTDFGELPRVTCLLGDLNQAFLNIIVNAAHAVADRKARTGERGTISVTTRHKDGEVLVAIEDTGDGIPEAVRPRIFDPFFTTKEIGRGTGQGLPIARSVVVDKHGGALTFTTRVGHGTRFEIRLPVTPAARDVAA